jgi:anaerobic magnesium-protoporphyrin IX monomethyl ester cyclase
MKISFIRAYNYRQPYQVSLPPLGIGYLASVLKNECPKVTVTFHTNFDELLGEKPDVVGISTASEQFGDSIEMARMAKEMCNAKVFVGGMHITALPHALPKCFDVGCIGEGEDTVVELIKLWEAVEDPTQADYEKVAGICFHRNKWVQVNPARPLIQNLDDLPYPDRDLLGQNWKVPYSRQVHLISSRGCPYDCSFCSSSLHWKRFRYFSPDYTANEIEYLRENYDTKEIYFFDDLFIANRKRFRAICDKFRERGLHEGVEFRSYARVDLIDEEIADLFEELNFRNIDFGFESNSQPVLDYFRKRNVTPEINQRAVDILAHRNVSIGANFIIGSPPETPETLDETLDFAKRNRDYIDRVSMGPLFPLPGTPIWEEAKQRGMVADDMTEWDVIGFDPDNFNIADYRYFNENMSRDYFYQRYLEFRGLTREMNLIGQLRKSEWRETQLQSELDTLRGSRIVKSAWNMRNGLGALKSLLTGGSERPVEVTTNGNGDSKKKSKGRIGINPKALEEEKAAAVSASRGLPGFKMNGGQVLELAAVSNGGNGNGSAHTNGSNGSTAPIDEDDLASAMPHP